MSPGEAEKFRLPDSALPGDGRQRHGGPGCGREWSVGHHGHEGEQQHPGDEDLRVEHAVDLGMEHHTEPQLSGRHVHRVRGAVRSRQDRRKRHQDPSSPRPVQAQHDRDRAAVHQPVQAHHDAGVQPAEGPSRWNRTTRRFPLHLGRGEPAHLPRQVP